MVARNVNNRLWLVLLNFPGDDDLFYVNLRLGFALYNKNINSHLYTYAVHRYLLFCSNNLSRAAVHKSARVSRLM